ncbi:hypothetical protein [uncultured Flavobacterium sp.]|uniref:hypothetical protein n=1 Tax=uncultured Flavobacterium sp. TaxID=165435 RepID=UPI0030EBC54C|tara:strand:+ start:14151 stop:14840 length:690 start_codon:yes stop_codon:yes gene_type:complete
MYKLTLTILLAVGIMAFKQPKTNAEELTAFKATSPIVGEVVFDISTNENTQNNSITFDQKHQGDKGKQGNKKDKGNKSHKKNQQNFAKKNKESNNAIKQVSKKHNYGNEGHKDKKHYEKGHPNFNYVFVNKHGYFSHKNYGQWRSKQAKMKHKKYHPVYEYQAVEGFRLIHTRNIFLYDETDYKINLLNTRLAQKRKANEIDVVAYDGYMTRILELQERRAALNININL